MGQKPAGHFETRCAGVVSRRPEQGAQLAHPQSLLLLLQPQAVQDKRATAVKAGFTCCTGLSRRSCHSIGELHAVCNASDVLTFVLFALQPACLDARLDCSTRASATRSRRGPTFCSGPSQVLDTCEAPAVPCVMLAAQAIHTCRLVMRSSHVTVGGFVLCFCLHVQH